jgi:hypothetical protein
LGFFNAGFKSGKTTKGVSLIIAVFTMMLLAVLGLTLAMMISGDFEMNTRNLESEQAFYLADSGIQDALMHLSLGDAAFDNDADYLSRRLANGEYNVTRVIYGTYVNITSRGYVPSQANYRAMRQIKAVAPIGGGLTKGIGCGGRFDWSAARAGHTVAIDADISAAEYNGDGNGIFNQNNSDYGASPLLPPGGGARAIGSGSSTIPMQWYHDNADCEWPSPGTRVITNTAAGTSAASTLRVTGPIDFFTGMVGQAVRNVDHPVSADGSWADADWAVITAVANQGRDATLDRAIGEAWDNHRVRLARRYSDAKISNMPSDPEKGDNDSGAGSGINYVGATISHGMGYVVDTVIDLRSSSFKWQDVKIICEGDIFIKGSNALEMTHSPSGGSGSRMHPPLATQNGNIICLDATTANNRVISGLIFSETGTVNWNYIKPQTQGAWLRGTMIYGQNIILDGDITLAWLKALVPPEVAQFGVTASSGNFTWQEQ